MIFFFSSFFFILCLVLEQAFSLNRAGNFLFFLSSWHHLCGDIQQQGKTSALGSTNTKAVVVERIKGWQQSVLQPFILSMSCRLEATLVAPGMESSSFLRWRNERCDSKLLGSLESSGSVRSGQHRAFHMEASRVICTAGSAACSGGSGDLLSVVLWQIVPQGHLGKLGLWERSGWSLHQQLCTALKQKDIKKAAFCFPLSSWAVPEDWKENFLWATCGWFLSIPVSRRSCNAQFF